MEMIFITLADGTGILYLQMYLSIILRTRGEDKEHLTRNLYLPRSIRMEITTKVQATMLKTDHTSDLKICS